MFENAMNPATIPCEESDPESIFGIAEQNACLLADILCMVDRINALLDGPAPSGGDIHEREFSTNLRGELILQNEELEDLNRAINRCYCLLHG